MAFLEMARFFELRLELILEQAPDQRDLGTHVFARNRPYFFDT